MRYPWDADGLTHKDFGYSRAGDLLSAIFQKPLVKEMILSVETKLGPDPVKAAGDAEAVLARYRELVQAGKIHESVLVGVGESTAAMVTRAKVWTFLKAILAGMEG